MMTDYQIRLIQQLKGTESGRISQHIVVRNAESKVIGVLQPINVPLSNDATVVSAMTHWRRLYRECFLTQFNVTEERTRRWLASVVLPNPDRILFLIVGTSGQMIGHLGLAKIDRDYAEIDNVLRGERARPAHIMHFAQVALIRWTYQTLGIRDLFLRVFSDNARAIASYETLGFRQTAAVGLFRIERGAELEYREDHSRVPDSCERTLITMTLNRESFLVSRVIS